MTSYEVSIAALPFFIGFFIAVIIMNIFKKEEVKRKTEFKIGSLLVVGSSMYGIAKCLYIVYFNR